MGNDESNWKTVICNIGSDFADFRRSPYIQARILRGDTLLYFGNSISSGNGQKEMTLRSRLLLFALVFLGGCAFVLFLLWLLLKGVGLG